MTENLRLAFLSERWEWEDYSVSTFWKTLDWCDEGKAIFFRAKYLGGGVSWHSSEEFIKQNSI